MLLVMNIYFYHILNRFFFFLKKNQQFITQHANADHGSYFVTTYKKNRLTRGLKLKRKKKDKEKMTNWKEKEKEIEKQVQLGKKYVNCL